MAEIVYPPSLPALDRVPFTSFEGGDGAERFGNDRGPAKVRPVSTAVPDIWSMGHPAMSGGDLATLRSFRRDTLGQGALAFTMDSPFGGTGSFRFIGGIKARPLGGDKWSVTVQLEQLA
jgi:hypothetical protein